MSNFISDISIWLLRIDPSPQKYIIKKVFQVLGETFLKLM